MNKHLIILILAYILIKAVYLKLDDESAVAFIDVGQGDSILIENNDKKIVIDGGPDYSAAAYLSHRFLLNYCRIDVLVLTHPHSDHLSGLNRIINWCDIGHIIYHGYEYDSQLYKDFKNITHEKGIRISSLYSGDRILLEGIEINILWPEKSFLQKDINNINLTSYVLSAELENYLVVLTGDAEFEVQDNIDLKNLPDPGINKKTIFKLAHHGAINGFNLSFFRHFKPDICVISVGENKFGHPGEGIIKTLKLEECTIYRTDVNDSVIFKL